MLVFTCNHCPVARAYEDRLVALQKDYEPKGVQFVAVNVNNIPADRLDKMKKRAKAKGLQFPYLYDSTQKIGHDYGATVTPHVFVLDKDRKIAYMGAVDDNMQVDKVKKHYLRNALDASLAGKNRPRSRPSNSAAASSTRVIAMTGRGKGLRRLAVAAGPGRGGVRPAAIGGNPRPLRAAREPWP